RKILHGATARRSKLKFGCEVLSPRTPEICLILNAKLELYGCMSTHQESEELDRQRRQTAHRRTMRRMKRLILNDISAYEDRARRNGGRSFRRRRRRVKGACHTRADQDW
ncbi:MAG: hypothetical protein JXQ99_06100, partial [Hyphomicrobiaceae bacterium]